MLLCVVIRMFVLRLFNRVICVYYYEVFNNKEFQLVCIYVYRNG